VEQAVEDAMGEVCTKDVGRDSSVGIATRYGLDSPGIESRWGKRFSAPVQTGPGAHPASYTVGTGSFPGGKAAGAWPLPPTPSSADVKERIGLYLYSPSGPSWPVVGRALLYVARVGAMINSYIIFIGKYEGKGPIGSRRR